MQFDVVAIGGGFAGLIVANRCAQLGLRAAVLEKDSAERYPCNSRVTTGVSHILFRDMRLPAGTLEELILKESAGRARPDLAKAFASTAKRSLEWLIAEGAKFAEMNTTVGKSLMIAPPRRFKHGLDWEGRGPDVLLRTLEANLVKRGGQVLRGTEATSLVMANGACTGVEAMRNGKPVGIEARAVVLADGGFSANRDMIRRYITPRADRLLIRSKPGARGDGLRMAAEAGAHLMGFGEFYGHPVHRDAVDRGNPDLWPFPMIDPLTHAGIVVGADGRRFTDEGRGGIVLTNTMAHLEDPLSTTVVFDEAIWNGPGRMSATAANPMVYSTGAGVHKAGDLQTLAGMAGLPASELARTVRVYNEALAGKRTQALDPPRSTEPHAAMPIAKPPFYAIPLCAGITATMGGIAIDAQCRALKQDGSPIAGLYAAGTTIAGLEGGPNAAYLGGLSKAYILGLLAGEAIAAVKA